MHVLSVLTLKLAEAIGLYWFAAGVGLFVAPARLGAMVADFDRSPALVYIAGLAAFWIGAGILIAHHVTADPLAAIITIIALAVAIEGLVLLAFPAALLVLARPFVAKARLWGIVAIVLGAVLFLTGLTGRADYIPQGAI